ncbi:two component transcriptional regulator, LuxR family [Agrococcus baldri]|uniref:Two component transcriptional regulator, LuxR family n=1 Tax=Agrococcus baldri TaxID=153730 RepID=A0AA94HLY2_9MICO|nr:response regulator transcription factor [Agrococcus baldri]SFS08867.1 two component transcriptional regulator, LuxR family [Agrococcus baldri]
MTRILLVDDQALVRAGFETILTTEPGFEVVGQARDGAEGVRLAGELAPDVICMDVQMPVMDGLAATREIVAGPSHAAVLMLTTFDREDFLFEALSAGASGFLLKTAEPEHLIDAVHALARGDALLSPEVTRRVIERFAAAPGAHGADTSGTGTHRTGIHSTASHSTGVAPGPDAAAIAPAPDPALAQLTERERETLLHLARGRSNGEIAAQLFVGEATVKTHVSNVLMKLGIRDRIHAVIWAYEHGVIAPHS